MVYVGGKCYEKNNLQKHIEISRGLQFKIEESEKAWREGDT